MGRPELVPVTQILACSVKRSMCVAKAEHVNLIYLQN